MHLLASMLVGELLVGGLMRKHRVPRPGFDVKHVLPGRVRLAVPLLLGQDSAAITLAAVLNKLDGVSSAQADARTGSVLVHFADNETTRHEIIGLVNAFVQRHQPDDVPAPTEAEHADTGAPVLRRQLTDLGRSLNEAVRQQSRNLTDLHTLLGVGVGVWGLKTLLSPGSTGRLRGLTWLYWSYNLLRQPSPSPAASPRPDPGSSPGEAHA